MGRPSDWLAVTCDNSQARTGLRYSRLLRSVTKAKYIPLLFCGLFGRSAHAADDVPVLTVCEVMDQLPQLDGKLVIVVGRFAYTDEGTWLGQDCGHKVTVGGREFEPLISTTYIQSEYDPAPKLPNNFKWDVRALEKKLEQVKLTTKLRVYKELNYSDRWLAIFGGLETALPHKIDLGNGRIGYTPGFGHLSSSPAELIAPENGSHSLK
jgi:hypothetical protein